MLSFVVYSRYSFKCMCPALFSLSRRSASLLSPFPATLTGTSSSRAKSTPVTPLVATLTESSILRRLQVLCLPLLRKHRGCHISLPGLGKLEKAGDVLAHLVLPIRPVVAPLRAPIVQRVPDAFPGEDLRQPVRRPGVLPRPAPRGDVNVAARQFSVNPRIAQALQVIHRIVEVEIIVIQSVHEISQVVHPRHGKTSLNDVGMLEQRIRRVIRPKRRAHRRNRNPWRLATVPNEGHHFFAQVRVKDHLHVTSVKGMRSLIVKTVSINRINGEEFDPAAVDEVRQRRHHALPLKLPFIARARRKSQQRRAPVAVHHHAHLDAQPRRIPAVIFTFHRLRLSQQSRGGKVCQPRRYSDNEYKLCRRRTPRIRMASAVPDGGKAFHGYANGSKPAIAGTHFQRAERLPAKCRPESGD